MSLVKDRYFAAAPMEELGEKLWGRFELCQKGNVRQRWRWYSALGHYYGSESDAGTTLGMTRRGERGEIAAIRINRARRGSKARQQLILSGRVAFRARCRTADSDAELAQMISQAWLEYDFKENGLEQLWRYGVELSEVLAESYAFTEFDWTMGTSVRSPHGIARDGDVRTTILPPWLVDTDRSVAPRDRNWWFVDLSRPKSDLSMVYTRVLRNGSWETGEAAERLIWDAKPPGRGEEWTVDGEEEISNDNARLIVFIHRPTVRCPLGLFVPMLGADCILDVRPLIGDHGDYDETSLPIQRLAADEMAGTPNAWTPFYDVLATQELLDGIDTGAATIVTSFATPMYAIEKNSGEKPEKLVLGMRPWLVAPGGKPPTLIERPQVPESLLAYREALAADVDRAFSVNDDATGQNDSKDKNAQAEALRASMAVQQVSSQSAESRAFLRKIMECRLKTLRKNAKGERLLRAVGESQRHLVEGSRFFTGQQIEPLDSVELEESNPLEDTPQGRQAMLDYYGERGLIKSQEDVEAVLRTGRLSKAIDPIRDENLLIEQENEKLMRGELPAVFPTQNGILHMRQHMCVTLDSVTLEKRPEVLEAWDAHDREHWLTWFGVERDMDPMYFPRKLFIMGLGPDPMAPVPPPGMRGTAPPAQGQPSMTQPPAPGAQSATGPEVAASVQPTNGAPAVKLPENPMTKETFSPTAPPVQGPPS